MVLLVDQAETEMMMELLGRGSDQAEMMMVLENGSD